MIVATEWMDSLGQRLLEQLPYESLYDPELWRNDEHLGTVLPQVDALIVRNHTIVSSTILENAPHLKVIGRLGVGLDNIDLGKCHQKGVSVVYARGANAVAVVEFVTSALLYSVRPWPTWSASTKSGAWCRDLGGGEIYGKTLGIIGLGDIGSRVARMARMLGMTVYGYDPRITPFHALVAEGTLVLLPALQELLGIADAVTLHAPLNAETHHLLNDTTIPLMKPGTVIINTARGGLIDEAALRDALIAQRLGPVFLDVREIEPPPTPDPLAQFPNVYMTPHIAGLTAEATARTTRLVLSDVLRELNGKTARSRVRFRTE